MYLAFLTLGTCLIAIPLSETAQYFIAESLNAYQLQVTFMALLLCIIGVGVTLFSKKKLQIRL